MQEKQDINEVPNVEKDGWDAKELAEEAVNEEPDDIVKKIEEGADADGIPEKDRNSNLENSRDSNLDKS